MDEKQLSAAILKFSAKLVNELEKDKSLVSSPLLAEFVLALLALGTADPAHSELLTALGLTDDDALRASFSHLTSSLKSVQHVSLHVANKVYVRQGQRLEPALREDAVKVFDTETEEIDFVHSSAADRINKWVESKTNNRIKDIISKSALNASTQLVLVNAIYFLGNWKNPFMRRRTSNAPFYVDANTTISVPMMMEPARSFLHGHSNLGAQILVLPYQVEEAGMVFVLPNEVDGVSRVLQELADGHDLMAEVNALHEKRVHVSIPKFKIETEINLNEVLPKLGIKSIFSPGLDKMLTNKQVILVSKAVQKAFIEVNEEGTEAGAATKAALMRYKAPPRFIANWPFIYILTGPARTTLFVGVYRGDGSPPRTDLPKWTPNCNDEQIQEICIAEG